MTELHHKLNNQLDGLVRQCLFAMLCLFIGVSVQAQNCPENIDFEAGNFNGWTCYTGYVAAIGGQNVITLTPSNAILDRHTMLSAFPGNGVDPYGGFPVNCPNGSGHSIKLGNSTGGAEAEGVSYEFVIPAGRNEYNLIYNYAVVFQDPNHQQYEQPRMEIEITNVTDGNIINCSSFSFFPYGTPLPGFELSSNPGGTTPVWYKNWSAVSINLNGNAGKSIRLFFKTSDCTFRRHFGYAYIDVNTECSSRLEGASFCPDDSVVNVIAPYGYKTYDWYTSDFVTLLGSNQTLSLVPPPTSNMSVAVVVVPYNGYGCVDTLYTDITNNLVVTANAGKDTTSCNHNPVPIGVPPDLGVRYDWSPSAGLSNPDISNPVALPDTTTTYVLTARSKGGGCVTRDTITVKASLVDNNIQVFGKESYCIGNGDSCILVVQPADSILWFKDNIFLPNEHQTQYRVTESGSYYAILYGGNGCILNTLPKQISIASVPITSFSVNKPNQCLFGNQFVFSNTSTNQVGNMDYSWDMGDGTILKTRDIIYSYKKAGNYLVKLVVSSIGICADSATIPLSIYQNAVSAFDIESTCINIPVVPVNTTADTLGSPIFYLWSFGNGQTSALRNPPAQIYAQSGIYEISLAVSSLLCPAPAHIVKHSLFVDRPRPAVNYPIAFAVFNLPLDLHARTIGETILWNPLTNLDNAASFNPVFKGVNEQLYMIEIKTKTGCLTTDSQLVKLVKSIEIYVPTAFTPDGDGKNDLLRPVMFGIKQLNYFRIFNRWGQMFYETKIFKQGWDGIFKNVKQEMQTLVWMIEAVGVDGKIYSKSGTTVLIR